MCFPSALVDFSKSPELLSGDFNLRSGQGTLTIIEYPTPQIAAERERAIAAYLKTGNQPQQPFTEALQNSNTQALATRRSGLLVAITSGGFDAADAHKLLEKVNYEASVTWNNPAGYILGNHKGCATAGRRRDILPDRLRRDIPAGDFPWRRTGAL